MNIYLKKYEKGFSSLSIVHERWVINCKQYQIKGNQGIEKIGSTDTIRIF